MKYFFAGSAFLMLIASLPADATNDRVLRHESRVEYTHQTRVAETRVVEPRPLHFMQAFGETLPPIGHVDFCKRHPGECSSDPFSLVDALLPVSLTSDRWSELTYVNDYVNEAIEPVTDLELYGVIEHWSYPTDNKGDCEDYVLLKRRLLIGLGWPVSALLITVVRDENGEGHAVLTVRSDQGDYVLDNKRAEISLWTETPYTFIKRQAEANPSLWISVITPDQAPAARVSASNRE